MGGSLVRSRWAGIGAAVAVSLGAGGAGWIAHATGTSAPTSFVAITPCRLFDTRFGYAVGNRTTPLNAGEVFDRAVWGTNGACTIPATATAITFNLTVPDGASGFITVYPGDALTRPNSSTLNPVSGEGVKANAGVVGLSATGGIKLFTANGPVNAMLDITGYYVSAVPTHQAQIVTVAKSGADYTTVQAALQSITDSSSSKPYVVRVGPGIYTETGGIDVKNYVDIEGSGEDTTTITCACGNATTPLTDGSSATVRMNGSGLTAEIRGLTVINTGGGEYSTGVWVNATGITQFPTVSLFKTKVLASGGTGTYGVWNQNSTLSMDHVDARAVGTNSSTETYAVANLGNEVRLKDVDAEATLGTTSLGLYNWAGGAEINNSTLHGFTYSIANFNSSVAFVSDTRLESPSPVVSGVIFDCVGVFSGNYVALGAACN